MGKQWVHKDRPVLPNILEKQRMNEEEAKYRAAFWARRRVQTSQPRKDQKSFVEQSTIVVKRKRIR